MQADGALLELLFSLQAISGTSTATDSLMNYRLAWLDLLCHLATLPFNLYRSVQHREFRLDLLDLYNIDCCLISGTVLNYNLKFLRLLSFHRRPNGVKFKGRTCIMLRERRRIRSALKSSTANSSFSFTLLSQFWCD